MGVKYKMSFQNVQGYDCVVNFIFADYDDDPVIVFGGARPFTLQEFNSDNDYFKPIRPQQATIELLASASGISLEDFLSDNDTDIYVRFDFGAWVGYWYGYLSQDDLQETWISQNHILTLRADEGLGKLKEIPLSDNGAKLIGQFTPFSLIQYAAQKAINTFLNCRVFSNLFHTSMTATGTNTGLDQCMIDARTFESSVNEFDDGYTVIEKINRSFSQTLFQYLGQWWIFRMEENFIPKAQNLTGFVNNKPTVGNRAALSTRYMAEVGINSPIKPIMPEMIKTLNKPSKDTQVNFDWEFHKQIIQNQSFQEGDFIEEIDAGVIRYELQRVSGVESYSPVFGKRKNYSINFWNKINYVSPPPYTPSTAPMGRAEFYENNVLINTSTYIGGGGTLDQALEPTSFRLEQGYKLRISCKINTWNYYFDNDQLGCIQVQFLKDAKPGEDVLIKNLGNDGAWGDSKVLIVDYPSGEDSYKLKEIDVTSEPADYSGVVTIYLLNFLNFDRGINVDPSYEVHFSDLQIEIISDGDPRIIKGDYDKYTIAKNVNKNYEEIIYLDDAKTTTHKGALLEIDGITMTGDEWFRRRYNTERYTFKRHHAIARWFQNRSYRSKLECNFYGLVWESDGNHFPIGLVNTINFVDDAPKKTFGISNLREIDFMNCTWSADLVEIFDEDNDEDGNVPGDLDVHTYNFYYD